MINFIKIILSVIFWNHSSVIAENLALMHQISVLKRSVKKPKIKQRDRFFWVLLSKSWNDWKKSLFIFQPETVVKWHRTAFKLYWKIKSKAKPGLVPPENHIKIVFYINDLNRQITEDDFFHHTSKLPRMFPLKLISVMNKIKKQIS